MRSEQKERPKSLFQVVGAKIRREEKVRSTSPQMDYFETREEGKIQVDPLLDLVSSLDRNERRDLITPHRKSTTGQFPRMLQLH